MAVTKEQIFSAADELAAAGQKPTLEAVRQRTGGSYTTISPALNEWKARQATAAAPLREPAPQAVADRLAELGGDLWTIALDLANARLAAEREGLEKARAELEADRAEATELADKLAGDVEALQSRLASIEAAEQAARIEADELRGQLAAAQEQAHTAEAHTAEARAVEIERRAGELRTERDKAQEKAATSADQAEALRAELAAANSRVTEIERRAGELRADLERANQATDQARAALAEQQKAAEAAATERDQVRAELVKVQAKAEANQEAHQEQKKAAAAEVHRLGERLTAAQAERDQAKAEAAQAREEAARLAGQLTAHQEQNAALLARIQPAADQDKPKGRK